MQIKKRVSCLLLAVCLATVAVISGYATEQEIETARRKASGLEEEKKKVEASLKQLENLKGDAAAYIRQLDENLTVLNREMEQLSGWIDAKEAEINKTQQELEAAKEVEASQYASMKLRIKYMYECGRTGAVGLLLQSRNVVQMMNRAEYIRKISEYDKRMMDEYIVTKETIAGHEAALQSEREQLLALQEQTGAKQESVQILLDQKTRELKNFESQIDVAAGQISEYEKSIKAQEDQIKNLEDLIRREEEEARKAAEAAGKKYNTVSLGNINFIWPCPASGRITSGFGDRSSPVEGASGNHQGIDIGAGSGSSIVAAASGTVVISTYSYSAGNYIMLSHGGGVYTVYMHCSRLLVAEGQQVSQGQTIAEVGSTGYSTGAHLHFGIRTDGRYVNPTQYVSP